MRKHIRGFFERRGAFLAPSTSHVSLLRLKRELTRFVRDGSSPLHLKDDAVKKKLPGTAA